ncbi:MULTISPECIES: hypothetical protein [Sphingobium]|uniref:hypothetical protein n=1 Tax=Sphingobium sp. MI1205 TaxID=407020 RepID=UPI00077020B2|nr:hypothetical protein [Sphingobium sp. MI1205]AMK19809.1 hypothetical protein K663_17241 [Sphingobium sp. MI1205]
MKTMYRTMISAMLLASTSAMAGGLDIPRNARIVSGDGATLGRVDRVLTANDAVAGVQVIVGDKMVVIPGDTLSMDGAIVKTSLTRKEVRALR